MRVTDKKEARGSLKWIRAATNEHQDILKQAVISACHLDPDSRIDWVSPREDDDYAEYRDQDFLDNLGITL